MSIKQDWIHKIMDEARRVDKSAALVITIGKDTPDEISVFLISEYDFKNYVDLLRKERLNGSV